MSPSAVTVDAKGNSWITNEFLEEILRNNHPDAESISIVKTKIGRGSSKGDNYLSILHQVEVQYRKGVSDDIETRHLIVKSFPDGDFIQKFVEKSRVFEREISMYHCILPQIYEFAKERVGKDFMPFLTPKCFVTSRNNILVLEDLRECGYKMAERKKRLDLQHCRLVLGSLAKLHGVSAVLHETNPAILSKCDKIVWCEENRETICRLLPRLVESVADTCKDWEGCESISAKIDNILPNILDKFFEAVELQKGGFHVLIHGDSWINNMLFKYSSSGEPVEIKFVDLQISQMASPALDLSYFLYSSPQNEVRESHMDYLLQEYYRQLCDTMKKLGGNPEQFKFEDLKVELKRVAMFGFMTCLMTLGVILAESEDVPDMENIKEEDVDNGSASEFKKVHSSASFREAAKPLLKYFDELGIFD